MNTEDTEYTNNNDSELHEQHPCDHTWMWTIFTTAIGAGVLYLPINAGINGIWPLLILSFITLPMVYLAHRGLSRVVLAATEGTTNINDVIYEHFSEKFCNLFAFCYFLAIYPIILVFSVGLTNTINSFLIETLGVNLPRYIVAFLLLASLLVVIIRSELFIRKTTEYLAIPLACFLFALSVYLIPKWDLSYLSIVPSGIDFFETLLFALPVMIFTFNLCSLYFLA